MITQLAVENGEPLFVVENNDIDWMHFLSSNIVFLRDINAINDYLPNDKDQVPFLMEPNNVMVRVK